MATFRGSGTGTGGGVGAESAADQDKRRRTVAMGKSGLQGYITSAQDALLRGFWQVGSLEWRTEELMLLLFLFDDDDVVAIGAVGGFVV